MKRNTSILIKDLNKFDSLTSSQTSKEMKDILVFWYFSPSKYKFIGYVDRTTSVILEARYHNIRDRRGRFTKTARKS